MLKSTLAISVLLLVYSAIAQNTARLEIKFLPVYHATGSSIYVAGSFNNWNPEDEQYKFKKDDKGNYFIDLKLNPGKYEYKITRGGWHKVECMKGGAGIENRVLTIPTDKTIDINIEEWQDRFPPKPRTSTASKNVRIIDTAFLIPQLKRIRRVWVYLPDDYLASTKPYPVLYMHDGQNIFDDASSFSGEWGVDEYLDTAKVKKCIVVGIDHGNDKRLNEYNPYNNERFGKGEGELYADFLVKTLKPFIDRKYRTLKKKENTYIAGSSMGGLISLYTLLKYPKVFGAAGIFSPAFWIGGTKIFDDIKAKGKKVKAKIYFYGGKLESESMVTDMLKVFEGMSAVSKSKMTIVIRDDGKHNEATWRKEFPLFYQWISFQSP